ncbi:HEAT repeat domain-containing protein [Leifsonia sp. AG29]|uniref:HEAT repeat domain-containing protein n=1 Tax=Leifsonia sp. AG29 TaxID=2598860 RepID=UPI00131C49B7|nr:HEAT repeat domain-containing protein [Leifsonia sp. AG29]
MVTFDDVFALAAELGANLPNPHTDVEDYYEFLLRRKAAFESYARATAELIADLRGAGVRLEGDRLSQLRLHPDHRAVPILARSLSQIHDLTVVGEVAEILSDRWAQPGGKRALIEEFARVDPDSDPGPDSRRFKLANAFARVASVDDVDALIEIVANPKNGSARKLPAEALGRFKKRRDESVPVLMELLEDRTDGVYSSAAHALGLLREPTATAPIESLLAIETESFHRPKLNMALKRIIKG